MRRSKVVTGVALAAGTALLASACGGGGGGGEGSSITIYGCEPQNPIIPGNTQESCGGQITHAMFVGLKRYIGTHGKPQNAMAKSIKTKDSQHYTITIKDGWKFQDGTPVTAKSFVRAWNWTAYAPNAALDASYLSHIKGFEDVHPADPDEDGPRKPPKPTAKKLSGLQVVDKDTFKVTLDAPFAVFPITLGYDAFKPLPKVFYQDPDKFGEHPIGNGPYKFVSWKHRQQIKLTRFDDYGGKIQPSAKNVTIRIYQKLEPAYRDLISGNLDFLRTMPVSALKNDQWKHKLGKRTLDVPQGAVGIVDFPLYNKKLKTSTSVKLRHAISLAVNRKQISDVIFSGSRSPADGWAPPAVNGYAKDLCGGWCTYDPKRAQKLWNEAGGVPDNKLTVAYNADGGHKAWMEAYCQSIHNVLKVKCAAIPVVDFATLRKQVTADKMTGMFRSGWIQDYPSIQDFLQPIYSQGAGANDTKYYNPEFEKLLAKASKAPSVQAANKIYQQAERLLAKDMPSIPVYFYRQESGWSKKISNVHLGIFGYLQLRKVKLT